MTTRTITLYTKDECVQCDRTKAWLNKKGETFTEVDLLANPEALAKFKEEGITSAPIVTITTTDPDVQFVWGGFIPDNLNKHAHSTKAA